jgi:trans-L-3-hydroxyproline dehydratase
MGLPGISTMRLDWTRRDLRRDRMVFTTIDAHAGGEPLRIITGGLPELPGRTMLERRRWLRENLDHLRRALMHEPRGHFDMYGCVLTPPVTPAADLGVLFLHNEGYSTMCGHGVIALVTALVETGAIAATAPRTVVQLDTPAGLVRATAHLTPDETVHRVSFRNVPSFVYERDLVVEVPGYGRLRMDIAFGGAFYAILPAAALGLRVTVANKRALIDAAAAIKAAVHAATRIQHPLEEDLSFLYGVIFTDEAEDPAHHSRNLCVFAASEVDRSPTGTGVSARLALHCARGELALGQTIAIESILGKRSVFEGCAVEPATFGPFQAIIPEVSGEAFLTGRHEFLLDPDDPLSPGFLL